MGDLADKGLSPLLLLGWLKWGNLPQPHSNPTHNFGCLAELFPQHILSWGNHALVKSVMYSPAEIVQFCQWLFLLQRLHQDRSEVNESWCFCELQLRLLWEEFDCGMITFFWNGCPWPKAAFHHKPAKDSSGEVCADQGVVRGMECKGDTEGGYTAAVWQLCLPLR